MTTEHDPLAHLRGKLLTIKDCEEQNLGSRTTIYREVSAGQLRATKINGRFRLIGDSMADLAQRGMIPSTEGN